uniref:Tick transposon n=1 Tax=Haemonchus contortus TaxID=6289 RepID=A0A7I4YM37_HAECO
MEQLLHLEGHWRRSSTTPKQISSTATSTCLPTILGKTNSIAPSVLPSEIRHAITSMKSRTAPGSDRNKPEHPRNLPPAIVRTLARLFTRYLSECKVPTSWKTGKTVLLYKKGDPDDIGNYRPICLLSVIYKLFTRVILNRTGRILDEGQPCEQGTVRTCVRGCARQVARRSS